MTPKLPHFAAASDTTREETPVIATAKKMILINAFMFGV
jgi:hypothetical protein